MKKLFFVVMAILGILTAASEVSGYSAIVNGEEVEGAFYNYFSVEIFSDYGCHDTNCIPVYSHDEMIFKFWMMESQIGNGYNAGWVAQLHVGYNPETGNYYIEEIVDVPSQICDMEGNCWEWQEITSEIEYFANEIIWLANETHPINGEVSPIMFDGHIYPESLHGDNVQTINNYIMRNNIAVNYVNGHVNDENTKTWFAMVDNNDVASITVLRNETTEQWYCAGLDNVSPDEDTTVIYEINQFCEQQADNLNFVENAPQQMFLPMVTK